jgi:hypothetical protein
MSTAASFPASLAAPAQASSNVDGVGNAVSTSPTVILAGYSTMINKGNNDGTPVRWFLLTALH